MRFKDYKVLISGKGSAIVSVLAKKYLEEGADVIVLGTVTADPEVEYKRILCNPADAVSLDAGIDKVLEIFDGQLDILINAIDSETKATIFDMTKEQFDRGMAEVLWSSIRLIERLYKPLQAGKHANSSIINLLTVKARLHDFNDALVSLSKNALGYYTKLCTAGFLKVRCNNVLPGDADSSQERAPNGSVQPDEVARVITYLTSTDGTYINGADFLIDGGESLFSA
ncbi:3-oxoacyl-[acyl-carrier-protein] reductase [Clostridia bacterium]|nr:3-oxoacyl-[acyl-carrier-protein] reductase [Clostridia bacterium]GHU65846.1 3-oxoacyl-[acyl-carrier-protein] reductase [Clostridia bacterium]